MALFRRQHDEEDLKPADPEEDRKVTLERDELAVLTAPRSAIAEQYRRLRNSIQALNPDGAPRTVVITSSQRGEGKTVGLLNLALAMAEMPRVKVLCVDADLYRPALESYLQLPRRQGLTELLRGKVHMDQAIRPTSCEGLSILGAGELPRNSSKLLGSDRIKSVLHSLKQRFDYVLIDTPPALAITDASLLGAAADGILMVVRLGSTPRHLVEQTHNLLENLGGNVLGTCLTGLPLDDAAYQY